MELILKELNSRCNDLLQKRLNEIANAWRRVGEDEGDTAALWQRMQQLHSRFDAALMRIVRPEFDFELSVTDDCVQLEAKIKQLQHELATKKVQCQLPRMQLRSGTHCERRRQLQLRVNELQFARLRCELQAIFKQVHTIWFRLQLPEQQLEQWKQLVQQQRPTEADKRKLLDELQRLKLLVLPRMPQYIASCRQEIQQLRDQTFASHEEIEAFAAVWSSDDFSEKLLQLHEREVSRLRDKLNANSQLYAAVTEWQTNWDNQHQLQMRMKDPAVLNNRGGILLRIEKEMKRAAAAAAASEQRLMQLHAATPHVLICGQLPTDFIASAKLLAEAEKENEAKERQVKHETTLRREMRYGSKPVSPVQRKLIFNSTRPQPTVRRNLHKSTLGCSGKVAKQKNRQKKSTSFRAVSRLSRHELEQLCNDSTIADLPNASRLDIHGVDDVSGSTNYSDFRLGIAFRSSSVMPATQVSYAHDSGLSSLDHRHDVIK